MYSPEARKAMTSETRGQNSWVNYGPHGETNRSASQGATKYADQKTGLLPDWAIHEGAGDQTISGITGERFAGAGRPEPEAQALGAINDAVYTALAKRAGMSPDELAQKFPLPGVQKAETAPDGALYQSSKINDAVRNGGTGAQKWMEDIYNEARREATGHNDVPLIIDNTQALYKRARDFVRQYDPELAKRIEDPANRGYDVLKKIFFTASPASQAAADAFVRRLSQRRDDRDPASGPKVASAQTMAFREWETFNGERFAELKAIRHPTLVMNGVHDEMIPVANSYRLSENLPNAVLLTYPDAGHGSLFQYPESFTRHAAAFLSSNSESAAF